MRTKTNSRMILAVAALTIVAGATEVRAQPAACSPSISASISRSTGGTCPLALSADDLFTLTYKIENLSVVDGGPATKVKGEISASKELDAILAQMTAGVGGTPLPGVLEFVRVCAVGSSVNLGGACAIDADCGIGKCGCVDSLPGVTCVADGANGVTIVATSKIEFNAEELKDIATIRVKSIGTVVSTCGVYFTRIDSAGDIFVVDDPLCAPSIVTAGAQASANLHAPECTSNADCGDTACSLCNDLGTNSDAGTCEDAPDGTTCDTDSVDCTEDACNATGDCVHTPDNLFCDDADSCTTEVCNAQSDCVYDFICEGTNICRSPGYWATHSGCGEKEGSTNVGQLVIDAAGPLEVCGEAISTTSDCESPFVDGLGLTSNLEGLCVRVRGVKERQLYRQLMAAALNCGISGDDCETITGPLLDVSYDDCNDVCAGIPVADGPTVNECISQLDCFNNGGQMIDDACVYDLPGNCHEAVLCNESIGVCPKKTPASSSGACKEARANDCTIDDCD